MRMTFEDDMLRLDGRIWVNCKKNGVEWPPPERVVWNDTTYVQVSRSRLTDEQRSEMTHVFRGAEYERLR
jgi:hypothetical protein